jgi:two-component system CheB/CheR fusion protein
LLAYYRQEPRLRLPSEEPAQAEPSAEAEAALRDVLALLRTRTGHDFSDYKRATVLRRLARRLQVNGLEHLPAYLQFLRTHPGEAQALLQDLLISVTNFFRDPQAFGALEAELARLFAGKTAEDQVRVWVAGCSSGEEAYSVAMLLAEQAARLSEPPSIQVFATDLDEAALRRARPGL